MKKIYKVWDIDKDKYYSSGKKSSWTSKTWAENVVDTICSDYNSRFYGANNIQKNKHKTEKMQNFEIHEFELVLTNSYNAGAKLMDIQTVKMQIGELEKEISYSKEWLSTVLKLNLSIPAIFDFYDKGVWNDSIRNQIKPVKESIDANTAKVNELKNLIKNL